MYRNELVVHIREYVGGEYPTRKGACLIKTRWATFVDTLDEIDEAVRSLKNDQPVDFSQHIGGKYYVTVSKGVKCVNIRKFFLPPGCKKERPTRTGISLRLGEWETLKDKIEEIHERLPELKAAKPCYHREDHYNQSTCINCSECNPFGVESYGLYNV